MTRVEIALTMIDGLALGIRDMGRDRVTVPAGYVADRLEEQLAILRHELSIPAVAAKDHIVHGADLAQPLMAAE